MSEQQSSKQRKKKSLSEMSVDELERELERAKEKEKERTKRIRAEQSRIRKARERRLTRRKIIFGAAVEHIIKNKDKMPIHDDLIDIIDAFTTRDADRELIIDVVNEKLDNQIPF